MEKNTASRCTWRTDRSPSHRLSGARQRHGGSLYQITLVHGGKDNGAPASVITLLAITPPLS